MDGEAGKGDTPRPVNKKKYDINYERAFGRRKAWWQKKSHQQWVKKATKDKADIENACK